MFCFYYIKKMAIVFFILLSCLILLAFFSRYSLGIHTLSVARQEIIYDVMLDWHGGIDPGAIGEEISTRSIMC